MVDAADSKSVAERRPGSSPGEGTTVTQRAYGGMVDTTDLKSVAARRPGSSPGGRTKFDFFCNYVILLILSGVEHEPEEEQ